MVRAPPSEHSFASCMLHDIELRREESYQDEFLVENAMIRLEKYVVGWEQVFRERKQDSRPTVYAKPLLDHVREQRDVVQAKELLASIIHATKEFVDGKPIQIFTSHSISTNQINQEEE